MEQAQNKQEQRRAEEVAEQAFSGQYDSLETASSADLVRSLGSLADGAPDGDPDTLDALDAVLCALSRRSDVDKKSRRWLETIHTGVRQQLETL